MDRPATSLRHTSALTLVAWLAVVGVGVAQVALDDGIAVWTIALPLVALLAWATRLRRAALVVALGVATWPVAATLLDRAELFAAPLWYLNLVLRTAVMLLAAVLAAGWRRTVVHQSEIVRTDPMTGLANAREFVRLVDAELRRALRYEHPFTVVYVSLDGLPQVLQRGGAEAGAELVRLVAEVIGRTMRGPDTVASVREAELGVLMPETGPAAAQVALARMRAALQAELRTQKLVPAVTIGAVTWIRSEITVDQLLQRAYQMLYAAQTAGGERLRHEILDTADVLI